MNGIAKTEVSDRIGLDQAWQLDYWTNELGASVSELQRIIDRVGNTAAAVRKELRSGKSRQLRDLRPEINNGPDLQDA